MIIKKDNNRAVGFVETGMLAVFGGVAVGILASSYLIYAKLMIVCGVFSVSYYFLSYSKFDKLWRNLGLGINDSYPMQKDKRVTEETTTYFFRLPAGLSIEDFDKKKSHIECFLGRDIDIKYGYKEIILTVYNKERKSLYPYEVIRCKGDLEFPIGYDRLGKLITCDLSSGEPHMLIAGETGSGKSTVLRSIITNIIVDKPTVKLHLIDLKRGVEFQIFKDCRQVVDFCINRKEAEDMLNRVSIEVDKRYDLFAKHGCKDIKEYRKKGYKMDFEVVIIDEFASLVGSKEGMSVVCHLAQIARSAGVHMIISTQRPSHTIISGDIKANVGVTLGLKTLNSKNSEIIIGSKGLESLKGYGHGIFYKTKMVELQCPLLEPDESVNLIKNTYVKKDYNCVDSLEKIKSKSGEIDLSDLDILDIFIN